MVLLSRAPWLRYLIGAGVAGAVELAIPGGLLRDTVYCLVGVSAVVAMVVGVRRHRPARRLPWHLLTVGVACWVLGDVLWTWFDHVAQVDPFPSVADVAYLLAYPLLGGGLYALRPPPPAGVRALRGTGTLVDALIVAVATGLVLWVVFLLPTWTDPEGTLLARLVGAAYPVGDVVLITMLVHLGAGPMVRTRSLRLLGAGFGVILCADLLFQASGYVPLLDEHVLLLDALWLAAYILWAAAALDPSMRAATEPCPRDAGLLTRGRVIFLGSAVLLLPGLIVIESVMGTPTHTFEVSVAGALLVMLAVTRMLGMVGAMRRQADRLERLATTDFLTGLETRQRFIARLAEAIGRDGGRGRVAVVLVALDRFAEINDTLGHQTGDSLLRGVAARLTGAAGTAVSIARMGGDAFGILLVPVAAGHEPLESCERIRAVFDEPLTLADVTVTADVSIGLAEHDGGTGGAADLLRQAYVALAAARERPGRLVRYSPDLEAGGALVPQLMTELRTALAAGQLVVHYQPQVEAGTGRVFAVEALVRWRHPQHGLLGPLSFIPGAERTGQIRALTQQVLDQSLAQCAAWRRDGRDLTVAVNLSVRNLLDPGLVDDVRAALTRHGLEPAHLELEVTETMAMVDPVRSLEALGALDDLGVSLAIDDYGTGYGSLAYLQALPVHRLKVDRSFVAEILHDPASAAIVRSTIELANHLGLSVVAEGVEDDETALALCRMGCFGLQGFGLGRPVAAEDVPDLVDRIESRLPALVGAPAGRLPVQRTPQDGATVPAPAEPATRPGHPGA